MKIALIATGPGIEYSVAENTAKDAFLLIIDPETMSCKAMQNPLVAARGPAAGKLLSMVLTENNVWAMLVQNSEFKILKELADADIQILVGMTGYVRQVVEQFRYSFSPVNV